MREADLAGPDLEPAADQRRHRRPMVRASGTAGGGSIRPPFQLARDRGDHRHFERLGRLQRRQDPRQAGGEQRLARARRPAHQQVVPSRRGDLERALGDLLALDLGRGPGPIGGSASPGAGGGSSCVPLRCASSASRSGAARPRHRPPSRLAALRRRADQPLVLADGVKRREQHAGRRRDPPVEARARRPRHNATGSRHRSRRSPRAGKARSAGRNASLPWAGRPATG